MWLFSYKENNVPKRWEDKLFSSFLDVLSRPCSQSASCQHEAGEKKRKFWPVTLSRGEPNGKCKVAYCRLKYMQFTLGRVVEGKGRVEGWGRVRGG